MSFDPSPKFMRSSTSVFPVEGRRFMSVGGRKTRAGAGTTHSQMSIRQTQSIPSAPGKAGRPTKVKPQQFYVPIDTIVKPQVKHAAPSGRWARVDTAFADTLAIDDQFPGAYMDAVEKAATMQSRDQCRSVVASLKEDANAVAQYRDPVQFISNVLDMNSGPTYEDAALRNKKRRMWFSLVRAYHDSFTYLWGCNISAPLTTNMTSGGAISKFCSPAEILELIASLSAANVNAITQPEPWESEPLECYKDIDVSLPSRILEGSIYNSNSFFQSRSPSELVELAVLLRDSPDALRRSFDALVIHPKSSASTALSFVRAMGGKMIDTSPTTRLGALLTLSVDGVVVPARITSVKAFLNLLADDANGESLDIYNMDMGTQYAKVCTILYRCNGSSVCNSMLHMPIYTSRVLRFARELTRDNSKVYLHADGYVPARDFEEGIRLSHKDIHPHMKVRALHAEGLESVRLGTAVDTALGEAVSELNAVSSMDQSIPLLKRIQQSNGARFHTGGFDLNALAGMATNLLSSGGTTKDVEALLARLDNAVSSFEGTTKQHVLTVMSVYGQARYSPKNKKVHEVFVLKGLMDDTWRLDEYRTLTSGCLEAQLLAPSIVSAVEAGMKRAIKGGVDVASNVGRILVSLSHGIPVRHLSAVYATLSPVLVNEGVSFVGLDPLLSLEFAEVLSLMGRHSRQWDVPLLTAQLLSSMGGSEPLPWPRLVSLLSTMASSQSCLVGSGALVAALCKMPCAELQGRSLYISQTCDNLRVVLASSSEVVGSPVWSVVVSAAIEACGGGLLSEQVDASVALGKLLHSQGVGLDHVGYHLLATIAVQYFTYMRGILSQSDEGDVVPGLVEAMSMGKQLQEDLSALGLLESVTSLYEADLN